MVRAVVLEVLQDFHAARRERCQVGAGEVGSRYVAAQDFVTVDERGPRNKQCNILIIVILLWNPNNDALSTLDSYTMSIHISRYYKKQASSVQTQKLLAFQFHLLNEKMNLAVAIMRSHHQQMQQMKK